jgi:hypothetical protein
MSACNIVIPCAFVFAKLFPVSLRLGAYYFVSVVKVQTDMKLSFKQWFCRNGILCV